ncbi:hypothetical protein LguiB_001646 [Lonicera macranthoides]
MLDFVDLQNCRTLAKLPRNIGKLGSLKTLIISGCNIGEFPSEMRNMKSLKVLNADGIFINALHNSSGEVKWWQHIVWSRLPTPKKGPQTLWASLPCSLRELSISGCNLFDESFPVNFGDLCLLTRLDLSNNTFQRLPNCIRSLCGLNFLDMSQCHKLQSLDLNGVSINSGADPKGTGQASVQRKILKNLLVLHLGFFNCAQRSRSKPPRLGRLINPISRLMGEICYTVSILDITSYSELRLRWSLCPRKGNSKAYNFQRGRFLKLWMDNSQKFTEDSTLPKCSEQPDFSNWLTSGADLTTEELIHITSISKPGLQAKKTNTQPDLVILVVEVLDDISETEQKLPSEEFKEHKLLITEEVKEPKLPTEELNLPTEQLHKPENNESKIIETLKEENERLRQENKELLGRVIQLETLMQVKSDGFLKHKTNKELQLIDRNVVESPLIIDGKTDYIDFECLTATEEPFTTELHQILFKEKMKSQKVKSFILRLKKKARISKDDKVFIYYDRKESPKEDEKKDPSDKDEQKKAGKLKLKLERRGKKMDETKSNIPPVGNKDSIDVEEYETHDGLPTNIEFSNIRKNSKLYKYLDKDLQDFLDTFFKHEDRM